LLKLKGDCNMKWIKWILVILLVFLCLGTGLWFIHRASSSPSSSEQGTKEPSASSDKEEPVAKVRVVSLKESRIEETVTVYGSITAVSQELKNYNVPFESQIKQVYVTIGQIVHPGDKLVEIEPSLAEKLEFQQAQNDAQTTQDILTKLNEKLQLKLATRQELLQAQQAADQAKLKLDNLVQEGIESLRIITAADSGIVSQLDIQNGQIIPANSLLVSVINKNKIAAHVGINPEKVNYLQIGQPVYLFNASRMGKSEITGTIRLISQKVNPDTRLVDLYITLPQNQPFLLSDFVTGRIIIRSVKGLVVPREAVLPEEKGYILYSVDSGKAISHHVQIGLETNQEVQVLGKGLSIGTPIVIQGNYELQNGMSIDTSETK
jgi:membrane fusion protein, multidrug efflux system